MAPRSTRVNPDVPTRGSARSFAQVLDGYYRPARDTRKEKAFQNGISGLTDIFESKQRENIEMQRENEYQQGLLDAQREAAGEELQGVKTGSILRQHSRFYTAGLNEARGKQAAYEFKSRLEQDYLNWDGRMSDDPNEIRAWVNQRTAEFLESLGNDQHKMAGALPILNETAHNLAVKHNSFTNKRLQVESQNAYSSAIFGQFDSYHDRIEQIRSRGYSDDIEDQMIAMEQSKLIDSLVAEADEQYAIEGPDANNQLVQTAINAATAYNDITPINILVQAHESGKMKLTPDMIAALENGANAVGREVAAESRRMDASRKAEVEANNAAILSDYAAAMEEDPLVKPPSLDQVLNRGGDYQVWTRMQTVHKAKLNSAGAKGANGEKLLDLHKRLEMKSTVAGKEAELTKWTEENPGLLTASQIDTKLKEIREADDPETVLGQLSDRRKTLKNLIGEAFSDDFGLYGDTSDTYADVADMAYAETVRRLADSGKSVAEVHKLAQDAAVEAAVTAAMIDDPTALQNVPRSSAVILGLDKYIDAKEEPAADPEVKETPASTEGAQQASMESEGGNPFVDEFQQVVEEQSDRAARVSYLEDTDEEGMSDLQSRIFDAFTKGTTQEPRIVKAHAVMQEDPEFANEVARLADDLGVEQEALLAVMHFETGGSFDPAQKNAAGSSATGLIQFMANTARDLGTSTAELAGMTRVQQMQWVRKYFMQYQRQIRGGSVADVYMAVLYPAAVGKPDDYVLFRKGTKAYTQNRGLDRTGDGTVTKWEAARKVEETYYGYKSNKS